MSLQSWYVLRMRWMPHVLHAICKSLQHIATHCNTLQHTATYCNTLQHTATHCNTLQHTATYCNTLQHTASHCNTLQHTATRCNTLQHTATHCNTLQHTYALDTTCAARAGLRWCSHCAPAPPRSRSCRTDICKGIYTVPMTNVGGGRGSLWR